MWIQIMSKCKFLFKSCYISQQQNNKGNGKAIAISKIGPTIETFSPALHNNAQATAMNGFKSQALPHLWQSYAEGQD